MIKRPKSAVLLSVPYNFQTKQQAVDIKLKVKKSLLTFQTEDSLDIDILENSKNQSCRSYIDNGPSILNSSSQHYSLLQNNFKTCRTFKSLQNSRTSSTTNLKQNQKQMNTGLQNYRRLKPCKSISQKSLKNLTQFLDNAKKQSKFIDRIFQNISPQKDNGKKQVYNFSKKYLINRDKQNILEISGKNFEQKNSLKIKKQTQKITNDNILFNKPTIITNFLEQSFNIDSSFKTNIFQPTFLKRKGSQLLKKFKGKKQTFQQNNKN